MKISEHPLWIEAAKIDELARNLTDCGERLREHVRELWTDPVVHCGITNISVREKECVIRVEASDPMVEYDYDSDAEQVRGRIHEWTTPRTSPNSSYCWQIHLRVREGEFADAFSDRPDVKVWIPGQGWPCRDFKATHPNVRCLYVFQPDDDPDEFRESA